MYVYMYIYTDRRIQAQGFRENSILFFLFFFSLTLDRIKSDFFFFPVLTASCSTSSRICLHIVPNQYDTSKQYANGV